MTIATAPDGLRRGFLTPLAVLATALLSLVLLLLVGRAGGGAGGHAPHGSDAFAEAALFLAAWVLMIAAMMLPSSIPFIAAVDRVGGSRAALAAALNYLAAWTVLGILIWILLWLAGGAIARLPHGGVDKVAAISLILVAGYQLTPFARSCQRACARPFGILALHWRGRRSRPTGASAAGRHYALTCMGCCVAMIVMMVLIGLHDLYSMLLFTGGMIVQKHPRWGAAFATLSSAAIGAAGLAILSGLWTPGLHRLGHLCGC